MDYNFIAIEGNIGAGKTTLAKMLAEHYGAELMLESFEDNAFLPKFYREPERYAFSLELSFLADRFKQLKGASPGPNLFSSITVSDYYISKSLIFGRTNLSEDEYRLFWQLFEIMFQNIQKPDLLVYLYTPVEKLMSNIRKRGRRYEQGIQPEYLESIQQQYLDFLRKHSQQMRIVLIDTSELDFVEKRADFDQILSLLEAPVKKTTHNQTV